METKFDIDFNKASTETAFYVFADILTNEGLRDSDIVMLLENVYKTVAWDHEEIG